MVAVGYMDPGNWATSIAGGSQFGYSLLAVIFASNLMAMLFQAAAVRLGLASGRDLAQACRAQFSPRIHLVLWFFCEIAIDPKSTRLNSSHPVISYAVLCL